MGEDVGGLGPLPEGARLLHIGPPKTGSTSLQAALFARRDELAAHGAAYPGNEVRWQAATREAIGEPPLKNRHGVRSRDHRPWRKLKAAVAAEGDLRVCVSNEIFARADDRAARRVVRGLGGDRVHVVLVARELGRLLTSQWQERIKQSLGTGELEDWLRAVLGPDTEGGPHAHFWRQQDVGELVRRWSSAAGGRVVVVVGDHRDERAVPAAFESLLGLPEGMLDVGPDARNQSLTHGRLRLLRQLDDTAAAGGWPHYVRGLRRDLVKKMASHPHEEWETRVQLPGWARDRVGTLSQQRVAGLRESGARILGDPDALLQPPRIDDDPAVDLRLPVDLVRELVDLSRRDGAVARASPVEQEQPRGTGRTRR